MHVATPADPLGVIWGHTKFSKLNSNMTTMMSNTTRSLLTKITSSAIVFTRVVYRVHFPTCFLYYCAPRKTVSFQIPACTSPIFHSSLNVVAM